MLEGVVYEAISLREHQAFVFSWINLLPTFTSCLSQNVVAYVMYTNVFAGTGQDGRTPAKNCFPWPVIQLDVVWPSTLRITLREINNYKRCLPTIESYIIPGNYLECAANGISGLEMFTNKKNLQDRGLQAVKCANVTLKTGTFLEARFFLSSRGST